MPSPPLSVPDPSSWAVVPECCLIVSLATAFIPGREPDGRQSGRFVGGSQLHGHAVTEFTAQPEERAFEKVE